MSRRRSGILWIALFAALPACSWSLPFTPDDEPAGPRPVSVSPLDGRRIEIQRPTEEDARVHETDGRDDPAIVELREMMVARNASLPRNDPAWRTKLQPPRPVHFPPDSTYFWTLDTNHGTMKFRLRPDLAPIHVTNTIYLTRLGFYDGLTFHRVIPGFMAQGGCPLGNGQGFPGYRLEGEFARNVSHDRPGVLSTANAGPRTDGSQFFVTLQRARQLDGRHTIFGELVEGMDALRTIERLGSRTGATAERVAIRRASITVADESYDPAAWRAEGSDLAGGATKPALDGRGIVAEIDRFIAEMKIDRADDRWRTRLPRPPKYTFPTGYRFVWEIETNVGALEVTLWPHVAPMHVSNLIYLARAGFYDGLTFHRVVPGFMAQGGCPVGDGSGMPGYRFESEPRSDVRHDRRGLLAMATAGPDLDGSQFYLTFAATPHLDGKDTIFGEVTAGEETLDRIEACGTRDGEPSEPVRIERTRLTVVDARAEGGT